MARTSHHNMWSLALALAAGLLVTACGSTAGTPVPIRAADASASQSEDAVPGLSVGGTAPSDPGGIVDQNRTVALKMLVRVANTYIPDGSQTGAPIEVWAGAPDLGGKKLMTVPYGSVSEYFAPEITDPLGQGVTDERAPYTLGFYPIGAKSSDDLLIDQGEDASPGQKLTMVVGPNSPGSKGASIGVAADDIGSSPKQGGFTFVSIPKPPAGQAVLQLDAAALQDRPGMTDSAGGLTPSTTSGTCLPYFDLDSAGMQPTSTLHDMSSDTVSLFGGTQSLDYVTKPGVQIRVNQVKDQQSVPDACKDTPVFGPIDPKLAAGGRAYGIMYGPSLSKAEMLIIPVG